ncbi:glycosyltransferase family 2 protein [Pedobacter endophyticus]|uniref:Glycosyltransferase n=1 Tax=Pedobacter endophyticus TaxID=2789740 RepID=A0A7U3Q6J8_9SPHI|nr:glycosyltransferase [Pedobacter endophyticus]QPH38827.1 glycosyltransferase [Pedobacter endophyticus]
MEEKDLISVVVPVYNGQQYVKTCLEALLGQTYSNLEIIVINDGSTDQSATYIQEYPVKLINLEKNQGLSFARNTGMDAATGKFIHFMDVDDVVNLNYYELMHTAIVDTDADIACSEIINKARPQKSQRFKTERVYTATHDKLEATYVGKMGFVWRYLFNTDFLKKHALRFQEGRLMEDLMFSLPAVFFAEKVVVVPKAEYTYCHQENSIMTNKDEAHRKKRREDKQHAKDAALEFARKHNFEIPGVTTGKLRYIIKKWVT